MTDNAEEMDKIWNDSDLKWGVASLVGLGVSLMMLIASLVGYYFDLLSGIVAVVIGFASMFIGSFAFSGIDVVADSVKRNKEQNIPKKDANRDDGIRFVYETKIEDYIENPINKEQISRFTKVANRRRPVSLLMPTAAGVMIFVLYFALGLGISDWSLSFKSILLGMVGMAMGGMVMLGEMNMADFKSFKANETTIRILEMGEFTSIEDMVEVDIEEKKLAGSQEAMRLNKNIKSAGRKPLKFEVDLFRKLCEF
ncbi:hypothetical protein A3715_11305 [Oleiphilus sp. HI0009]|nr:hypothetical protein A3715_11305 [Oleiphilus sp. HI0009]